MERPRHKPKSKKTPAATQERREADFKRRSQWVLDFLRCNPRSQLQNVFGAMLLNEADSADPPEARSVHAMLFGLLQAGLVKSEIVSKFEIYWSAVEPPEDSIGPANT